LKHFIKPHTYCIFIEFLIVTTFTLVDSYFFLILKLRFYMNLTGILCGIESETRLRKHSTPKRGDPAENIAHRQHGEVAVGWPYRP
jgi:hypothetical protein